MIFQGTVSKKFTKKLKGEFNQQTRIMNQFKSLKALMFEPGLKVKFNNHFALKSAFRFTMGPIVVADRLYANRYARVHIAGYYVWHKEGVPLRVQYRTRAEVEEYFYWRNRLKIAWNFKQVLKPYTSFEIFNESDNEGFVDFYRYEAGAKWEVHESFNVTAMFRYEFNYGYNVSSKSKVFGLMVNYSLPSRLSRQRTLLEKEQGQRRKTTGSKNK